MTEEQAVAIVEQERAALEIDSTMALDSAERAIVQHIEDRSQPGRVEDRVAWIVHLSSHMGFVLVHVDDGTGEILEVLRTA